jgi:phosphoglycolate phosphatase-like HAD superfamily hydrolase
MTLVVFDIDGTLTNTKAIDDLCFIDSIRVCWNCDLRNVDWSTYIDVTDSGLARDIFKSLFNKEISSSEMLKLKHVFSSKIIAASEVNPEAFSEVKGAKDFIEELEKQDIKVAIATGGWKVTAEHKLKQLNVALTRFPYATSDDHYSRKEIIIRSIEKAKRIHKLNFNKIVYIGDGTWDYQASCELNIDFIGIDYNRNGKLAKSGATAIFPDYSDKDLILHKIRNTNGT